MRQFLLLMAILCSLSAYAAYVGHPGSDIDGGNPRFNSAVVDTRIAVGKTTANSQLDVAGEVRAQKICDSTGTKCIDMATGSQDTRCDSTGVCTQVCIGSECRSAWPESVQGADTRCDQTGTCSQVCIGGDCRSSWPTASGADDDWQISGNNIYNKNSGYVGVGLQNPQAPLDVAGFMRITANNEILSITNEAHVGDRKFTIAYRDPFEWFFPLSVSNRVDWTEANRLTGAVGMNVLAARMICDETGLNCKTIAEGWDGNSHSLDSADGAKKDVVYVDDIGIVRINKDNINMPGHLMVGAPNDMRPTVSVTSQGNVALWAWSNSHTGIKGVSHSATYPAVSGESRYGSGYAIQGEASNNHGVYGRSEASNKAGVYGTTLNSQGIGVWGDASAMGIGGIGVMGGGWNCDFKAAGYGVSYCSPSSIRWKQNITEIEDALGKIASLEGIYFNWDAEHGGRKGIGMIAEQVHQVIPEIVTMEPDGIYANSLDYSMLTPLLVEAVKELKAENEELRKRIEALE